MSENKAALAQNVYRTLCSAIDNRNWTYKKDEEKLAVYFSVRGEDIPLQFLLQVDEGRQLIRLTSPLPFQMSEENRMEGAIATCAITYKLADGSFDYDLSDGSIAFRMTASFRGSLIGEGLFQYMIDCAGHTVDEYNDKLFALDKGVIDITGFLSAIL